jgi:hypothetical protein
MKNPKHRRLNAALYAMALEEMAAGPSTRPELCEHTGLGDKTVQAIVRSLHQRRLIHIAAWEKDSLGRFTMAAFAFGRGADAKKPAPKTATELSRAYKERQRRKAALRASAGLPAANDNHRSAVA